VKIYRLPEQTGALIFDMDLTLYTSAEYARAQNDALVERLAAVRGQSFAAMDAEIGEYRRAWAASHGGEALSLSHIFSRRYGVSMEENIRWREESYEPARYLREDPRLREVLGALSGGGLALALVTNNAVSVARKTLAALGVGDLFPVLVGLDTCGTAKPDPLPFRRAAGLLARPPETCVSLGDRYDVDLAPPLKLGMGAILVDGVQDVYRLPDLFAETRAIKGGSGGTPRASLMDGA
jgi:phosphoglycolate phosphatase/putative hydrolase of the HAD superfamily